LQKYDTDPAAKAAAATSLASKLGADSGLKLYMEDESKSGAPTGKTDNVEPVQSSGLRNRKQGKIQSTNLGTTTPNHLDQQLVASGGDQTQTRVQKQPVFVEHHQPQSSTKYAGGWIAQIAALLVGEDPMQSYALICGNCYMHNGKWNKFNVTDVCFLTYIAVNERARKVDIYCRTIYGWLKLILSLTIPYMLVLSILGPFTLCALT
jgi:endoplasmic reticulum junction formation protein lunapark